MNNNDTNQHHDGVTIRRFQPADLSQVKELFINGMKGQGASDTYIKSSLESDLASLEKTYFSGRGYFWVMVRHSDNAIIGTVGLQDLSSTTTTATTGRAKKYDDSNDGGDEEKKHDEDDEHESEINSSSNNKCELRRMSIHSSERRKGRGRQLIDRFVEYAGTQKFDSIVLSTGEWMESAISFYLSSGFKDVGRVQYNHEGGTSVTIANLEYAL